MPMSADAQHGSSAHALAVAPSSFVGRLADLDSITARFEDGAQLVTITGLGGMGKTRLAQRLVEAQAASYRAPGMGGVWFCDLTGVHGPTAASAALASTLGVRLSVDGAGLGELLERALERRGRLLLVLDNFEQLADCARETLGRWMRAAPRARFLVTSRVALGLAGEHLWPLRPLALPTLGTRDARGLEAVESVELFLRRARQRRPGLVARDKELVAVAEIVRRLDGIPLAIELAAARVTVLSIIQLRDRLVHRLALLVRPGDDGRHASMRRAIADTWDQLGPAARACLAGCTIFAGGFSLAAAEFVLADHVGAVLPTLESLCLHSLVRATPRPELDGELRFSLFETIREFAAERLATTSETAARLADRHAEFFARLGGELAAPAVSSGGPAAHRLELELDNLIAAHRHALAALDARALSLALATHRALIRRGMARRALELLDAALRCSAATPATLAAAALARARARRMLGEVREARAAVHESLALARVADDPTLEALAHTLLGELVELDGATGDARAHLELALGCLAKAPRDSLSALREADVRSRLAHAYRREGALERAEREIARALELDRVTGSDDLPMALYEAAVIAWFRGRLDEALARIDLGLARVETTGSGHDRGALLYLRAVLLQERGELDAAHEHFVRALELIRESGNLYLEASALYYFAGVHLERGQRDDAAKLLERALEMFDALGIPRYQALIESCRATLFATAGARALAERSLAVATRAAAACRSERALAATVAIHGLFLRMVDASSVEREALLDEARALAEAHPSDDSRFALRAAIACLPQRERGDPLIVGPGARWLRLPGVDADIDLRRRVTLQRIILALARKRLEAPGEALALEDLLAAGWPGERVGDSAGANRVHVALSTLRKLGLRPFLISGRDGYALSSGVRCVLERADARRASTTP